MDQNLKENSEFVKTAVSLTGDLMTMRNELVKRRTANHSLVMILRKIENLCFQHDAEKAINEILHLTAQVFLKK